MKKDYSAPTVEILDFKSEDIIAVSTGNMAGFNGKFKFFDEEKVNSVMY